MSALSYLIVDYRNADRSFSEEYYIEDKYLEIPEYVQNIDFSSEELRIDYFFGGINYSTEENLQDVSFVEAQKTDKLMMSTIIRDNPNYKEFYSYRSGINRVIFLDGIIVKDGVYYCISESYLFEPSYKATVSVVNNSAIVDYEFQEDEASSGIFLVFVLGGSFLYLTKPKKEKRG